MTKEEIKGKASELAAALGYNAESLHLDVINVKDAFCIGFTEGSKEKDEYAKQQSIAFAKWKDEKGFVRNVVGELVMWAKPNSLITYNDDGLFDLFIESQNKQP